MFENNDKFLLILLAISIGLLIYCHFHPVEISKKDQCEQDCSSLIQTEDWTCIESCLKVK